MKRFFYLLGVILSAITLMLTSCKKDDEDTNTPATPSDPTANLVASAMMMGDSTYILYTDASDFTYYKVADTFYLDYHASAYRVNGTALEYLCSPAVELEMKCYDNIVTVNGIGAWVDAAHVQALSDAYGAENAFDWHGYVDGTNYSNSFATFDSVNMTLDLYLEQLCYNRYEYLIDHIQPSSLTNDTLKVRLMTQKFIKKDK